MKPTTIADLISLEIKPEERKRRKPVVTPLSAPLRCPKNAKLPQQFECEVFNFLLEKKGSLGIETVFKFKSLFVDGAVLLVDGRRLAVEIKLRMNWTKALQAESEFRRFLLTSEAKANPVNGAVVFFEDFEGSSWKKEGQVQVPRKWLESLVCELLQQRRLPGRLVQAAARIIRVLWTGVGE